MPDKEIWKDIEGYEGVYQVSNIGRIKSLKDRLGKYRELILKPVCDKNGYFQVFLHKNKISKAFKIHRLVAQAFIFNPDKKPTVNHINGKKTDNRVENLEWATHSEQTVHAFKNQLLVPQLGEKASNAKLKDSDIKFIRDNYIPYSREFGTYALAKKYGVGPDAIHRVIKRKTFKHIE